MCWPTNLQAHDNVLADSAPANLNLAGVSADVRQVIQGPIADYCAVPGQGVVAPAANVAGLDAHDLATLVHDVLLSLATLVQ